LSEILKIGKTNISQTLFACRLSFLTLAMIGISVETLKQTNQTPADKTQKHRRDLLERVSDFLNFHYVIYLKFQNLTNLKREIIHG